jgi:hypothetical protein
MAPGEAIGNRSGGGAKDQRENRVGAQPAGAWLKGAGKLEQSRVAYFGGIS